jgi:DNA polymerase I-like protein with 3'-5' exonuclease and polymerase domains
MIPPTFECGGRGYNPKEFFIPHNMSIRQAGKKSNHGLNYGMEYKRFALETGMIEADASHIVRVYRDIAYPGLKAWYTEVRNTLQDNNRKLTNCFGQTLSLMDKWDIDLFMAAYAFLPQSTVGNITNRGMRAIYHYSNRRVDLAAQVHDSVLTHHRFDSWEDLASQVLFCDTAMTQTCKYRNVEFILDRDVKLGINWGEDAMQEVGIQDLNSIAENLRLAYDVSCGKAQTS